MKDLLLLLSRYPFNETNRDLLSRKIGEVTDWMLLTRLVNSHGIIALAYYNLKESGFEKDVPPGVLAALENGYMQSIVRNSWLTERWKEVNAILTDAGIKHIVLKGMALEHTLYGSKGLRQMSDNDIFLRRDDALGAWLLLKKNGFTSQQDKSPLNKKILLEIGKHLPELHKDGYSVEIHHKLPGDILSDSKGFQDPFKDAVEIDIRGTKALSLSPELHLKYLISHFEKHKLEGNCQFRMFNDIILLDKSANLTFPDHFIENPKQEMKKEFRKKGYRDDVKSVPSRYRLRYITGDIFPSLSWMKKRYGCGAVRAVIYYPGRIGKVLWLM